MRSPIHRASAGDVRIAHVNEGGVGVSKVVAEPELDGRWIRSCRWARFYPATPLSGCRYCRDVGLVLHALGVVHSPWNMLSGVRFSCTTRMICWKEVIWAEAGAVRQSAASAKGNSWFTTLSLVTISTADNTRMILRQYTIVLGHKIPQ